jgi:hypothetical protein
LRVHDIRHSRTVREQRLVGAREAHETRNGWAENVKVEHPHTRARACHAERERDVHCARAGPSETRKAAATSRTSRRALPYAALSACDGEHAPDIWDPTLLRRATTARQRRRWTRLAARKSLRDVFLGSRGLRKNLRTRGLSCRAGAAVEKSRRRPLGEGRR